MKYLVVTDMTAMLMTTKVLVGRLSGRSKAIAMSFYLERLGLR